MQLFVDNSFFLWLVPLCIPAFILGIRENPIKYYGAAVSIFFIWMSMGGNLKSLAYMAGFVAYEYLVICGQLMIKKLCGERRWIYFIFLLMSIAPLTASKVLLAAGDTRGILGFAGISYMTFKAVQIVIDTYDGVIKEVNLFEYLYLMLFFPVLTAGPIDRSGRFNRDINRTIPRSEYLEMAADGIFKILLGMVYKIAVAAGFYFIMKKFGMAHTNVSAAIYLYTYGFYLFFDFAGYSLMAVGTAYLFGIRVPDNFNKPFLSKDIREFWTRWHITLSQWLRDYVFSRISMNLMRSGICKNKLTVASIALMLNMFIMGCWHGLESNYIFYGLYHGALLTAFEFIRKKSAFYKRHRKEKWFEFVSRLVTLHLVLIGFCIFSGRLGGEISHLLSQR